MKRFTTSSSASNMLYVGARYNRVSGELAGSGLEVAANRIQVGGGWFVTPYMLVKGTYVQQTYEDYPTSSIFHEGEFNGFMLEGVIAF